MNRDACNLVGDLLIQIDRMMLHLPPESSYRQEAIQKFLKLGYVLATENANSQKWQDANREALDLWKSIVDKLPYAGFSSDGPRKRFFS